MTFSATSRSSRRSTARYTVAMPPRAMRDTTSYRPSTRRPTSGSVTVAPTRGSLRSAVARVPQARPQRKRVMSVWTFATYRRVSANMPLRCTDAAPW